MYQSRPFGILAVIPSFSNLFVYFRVFQAANLSLLKYPPSPEELAMVHNLFVISKQRTFNPASSLPLTPSALSALSKPGSPDEGAEQGVEQRIVYPDETVITTHLITMPQHANVYGKVGDASSFALCVKIMLLFAEISF